MAGELRLEMTAAPERIGPDEQLTIRLAAVNEGPDPADSRLRESRLFVDGEPSMTWSLAISNGTGDVRERELPPGERIEAARQFAASLLRETLWSMVSEIHSTIDFDYRAYTAENLSRFEAAFAAFDAMER